jgi:hypothetical protein
VPADPSRDPQDLAGPDTVTVPDPQLRTIVLVRWGIVVWAVALVVLLAAPELRTDGRGWWLWVPVAGIVLGALGHAYLARGRGNARFA